MNATHQKRVDRAVYGLSLRKDRTLILGTAFLISRNGYFLTTAHQFSEVPRDKIAKFHVSLHNEHTGTISGEVHHCREDADLALLRAKNWTAETSKNAGFLKLSTSEQINKNINFSVTAYPEYLAEYDEKSHKLIRWRSFTDKVSIPTNCTSQDKSFIVSLFSQKGTSGAPVLDLSKHEVVGVLSGAIHDLIKGNNGEELKQRIPFSNGIPIWMASDLLRGLQTDFDFSRKGENVINFMDYERG